MFYKTLIFAFFIAAVSSAVDPLRSSSTTGNPITIPTTTTTEKPTEPLITSTVALNTTTSTVAPDTTPVAPNTTTSTVAPDTTPVAPNTTTSTVAPDTTTTTTAAPVTTPAPAPDMPWYVNDTDTGIVCIIAKGDLHFAIPYVTKDNKTMMADVKVPKNAVASGTCGEAEQTINLVWNLTNTVSLMFNSNTTTKQYWMSGLKANITVTPKLFVNITDGVNYFVLSHEGRNFETPLNNSYSCLTTLTLKMKMAKSNATSTLTLTNIHLDAFHVTNKVSYASAIECDTGTPDLVPVVMGSILGALIVIVLLIYLISRRRNQARGYLSM